MLKSSEKPPANTPFKQQRLRACQPIFTPVPVVITLICVAVIFIPLGVVVLVTSNDIREYEVRYDDVCGATNETLCTVELDVKEDMSEPVYAYYMLKNYYQNHRRYVKSRNDDQLKGDTINNVNDLQSCDPLIVVGDDDDSEDPNKILVPCGLIANSTFSDTFELQTENGTVVPWTSDGVAWESDLDKKFDTPGADQQGVRTIADFKDPDFVVWMRVAGLPTFRKLHRIIEQDVDRGTYTVVIDNVYDVDEFDGKKYFVLSTSSWIGGKNDFLGIAYIVVGTLCIAFAIAFSIAQRIRPRRLGDLSFVSWYHE
jgi:cell cycle control protein 50